MPITIDDAIYNWENGLAATIKNRVIVDFQDMDKFEASLELLIQALKTNRLEENPPSLIKV